jgi:hypothetical protein
MGRPSWLFSTIVVGAGALLVASCGAPLVPPNTANVARVCQLECKRLGDCRPGWDMDACDRGCRRDRLLPYFREDYVAAITTCLEQSTCDVILGPLHDTCWGATRPAPSDLARRAAEEASAKEHLCRGDPVSPEQVLDKWRWAALSDPVLEELRQCEGLRCGRAWRHDCIKITLGLDK